MISPAPRPQLCYPAGAYRGAVVAGDPHGAGSVLCALELERTCSNSGDLSAELMTGMFFSHHGIKIVHYYFYGILQCLL